MAVTLMWESMPKHTGNCSHLVEKIQTTLTRFFLDLLSFNSVALPSLLPLYGDELQFYCGAASAIPPLHIIVMDGWKVGLRARRPSKDSLFPVVRNGKETTIQGYVLCYKMLTHTITVWAETVNVTSMVFWTKVTLDTQISEPVLHLYFFQIPNLYTVQLWYPYEPSCNFVDTDNGVDMSIVISVMVQCSAHQQQHEYQAMSND
ncbi:hypothetical protein ARMGADRAFT_1037207 [Armillaria gallica]|uniref:Uncharacterized protein n=1 Tax=Armillaria gallica TaxID=47427 RepID=A0A2H3CMI1_ARMGA|nr:hypothetical protein ARMGADRAFT_1037207 [Armillaria gallica]